MATPSVWMPDFDKQELQAAAIAAEQAASNVLPLPIPQPCDGQQWPPGTPGQYDRLALLGGLTCHYTTGEPRDVFARYDKTVPSNSWSMEGVISP